MSYYICTDCALMLALVIGLFCSLFVIYLILWLLRIGLCDLFTYCQKKCRERKANLPDMKPNKLTLLMEG